MMKQLDIIADLLREGRTVKIAVRGNSMRPYLVHERDYVMMQGISADSRSNPAIVNGAVVLAELEPHHYVLHRIVRISGDSVTLQGDGNTTFEQCRISDILGVARSFIRKGRTIEDKADSFSYRLYSAFWTNTLCIRRYLLELHNIFFHSCKNLQRLTPTDDELTLFLSMIQHALWQKPLSCDISSMSQHTKAVIAQMARSQTVEGLIAHCTHDIGTLGRFALQHSRLNELLHKTFDYLNANGFHPILFKGQGNAARYPEPQLRQCGDIDLYVGKKDYKRACECIDVFVNKQSEKDTSETAKHYHVHVGNLSVEIHRLAELQPNPFINHRYQRFTERWLTAEKADTVQIAGRDVLVPPRQFNVVYVFNHLWHHFYSGGIGLRQLCDWAVLLHEAYGKLDMKELEKDLRENHLYKPWQIMGYIVVTRLGLPSREMPFYTNKHQKLSEKTWEVILEGGNFGRSKEVVARKSRKHWVLFKFRTLLLYIINIFKMFPLCGEFALLGFFSTLYMGSKGVILIALGKRDI